MFSSCPGDSPPPPLYVGDRFLLLVEMTFVSDYIHCTLCRRRHQRGMNSSLLYNYRHAIIALYCIIIDTLSWPCILGLKSEVCGVTQYPSSPGRLDTALRKSSWIRPCNARCVTSVILHRKNHTIQSWRSQ
jgi:hypothetical protein